MCVCVCLCVCVCVCVFAPKATHKHVLMNWESAGLTDMQRAVSYLVSTPSPS